MRFGWVIVCGTVLLAAEPCRAAIEREEFRWRVPLRGTLTSGVLYRVAIPGSVFDGSRSFPADLRLIDETGADWPFFIYSPDPPDPLAPIPLTPMAPPADHEERPGMQHRFFDTGHRYAPLRRIELQVTDENFARPVKVYGRNHTTNQWRWMADGGIHRLADRERDHITLPNIGFRYLKIEVLNYEEPPLTITNAIARAEPQYVVTLPPRTAEAWLYFGAEGYALPRFELQHRISRRELAGATTAEFLERERNPYWMGHELWKYGRLLLIVSIGIAGVLGLGVLLKKWRAARGQPIG